MIHHDFGIGAYVTAFDFEFEQPFSSNAAAEIAAFFEISFVGDICCISRDTGLV